MLVLTTFDLDEYVFAALRAGAGGFLLTDASAEELVEVRQPVLKLGLRDRAQAVFLAYESGVITAGDARGGR